MVLCIILVIGVLYLVVFLMVVFCIELFFVSMMLFLMMVDDLRFCDVFVWVDVVVRMSSVLSNMFFMGVFLGW